MMQDEHKNWFQKLIEILKREPHDREALTDVIRETEKREIIDHDAMLMLEGVLKVSEMDVSDVMVPKPKMIVIKSDMSVQEALPIIINSAHSRFPVHDVNQDKIIGILLAKDLLQFMFKPDGGLSLPDLIRPVTFIPESKRLDVLLKDFRLKHNHIAVVIDEYGNVAGLVTIEDVLEQIVGNIEDEYDIGHDKEPNIRPVEDDVYHVKALTPILEFNEFFNTDYEDEEHDTVGGLALKHFGHMPKVGETVQFDGLALTVLEATDRGVDLLRIYKKALDA